MYPKLPIDLKIEINARLTLTSQQLKIWTEKDPAAVKLASEFMGATSISHAVVMPIEPDAGMQIMKSYYRHIGNKAVNGEIIRYIEFGFSDARRSNLRDTIATLSQKKSIEPDKQRRREQHLVTVNDVHCNLDWLEYQIVMYLKSEQEQNRKSGNIPLRSLEEIATALYGTYGNQVKLTAISNRIHKFKVKARAHSKRNHKAENDIFEFNGPGHYALKLDVEIRPYVEIMPPLREELSTPQKPPSRNPS